MAFSQKKIGIVFIASILGILAVIMFTRLISQNSTDGIANMPEVGQLQYDPKKVKEETKIESFEAEKREEAKKAAGDNKEQISVPNFHNLASEGNNTSQQPGTNSSTSQPIEKNSYPERNQPSQQAPSGAAPAQNRMRSNSAPQTNKKNTSTSSQLNYHSDFLKNNSDPAIQQTPPVAENKTASKNPFGTITIDNGQSTQGQKQTVTQTNYYFAEIYGDQTISPGGVVVIRNTEAMQYSNLSIPRNSILYGQATFQGNRVHVIITRAKTPTGEYSVSFAVKDNDKIEGLYYKAPIDETVDNTKNNINAPSVPVPGVAGGIINSITQSVVSNGKDLMKRSASLNLEEGYKIYIVQK